MTEAPLDRVTELAATLKLILDTVPPRDVIVAMHMARPDLCVATHREIVHLSSITEVLAASSLAKARFRQTVDEGWLDILHKQLAFVSQSLDKIGDPK